MFKYLNNFRVWYRMVAFVYAMRMLWYSKWQRKIGINRSLTNLMKNNLDVCFVYDLDEFSLIWLLLIGRYRYVLKLIIKDLDFTVDRITTLYRVASLVLGSCIHSRVRQTIFPTFVLDLSMSLGVGWCWDNEDELEVIILFFNHVTFYT